jgi:hypothetical protein
MSRAFSEKIWRGRNTEHVLEAAYFQVHIFANAFLQSGDDEIVNILPRILGANSTRRKAACELTRATTTPVSIRALV